MKCRYLTFDDRKKIEALYVSGASLAAIADTLGVHLVTIYRELARGSCGDLDCNGREKYSAEAAQRAFIESVKRRGKAKDKPKEEN